MTCIICDELCITFYKNDDKRILRAYELSDDALVIR